jgi:hypothetical protein
MASKFPGRMYRTAQHPKACSVKHPGLEPALNGSAGIQIS